MCWNDVKVNVISLNKSQTNLNMSELHHFRGVGSCMLERTERHNQPVIAHSPNNWFARSVLGGCLWAEFACFPRLCDINS